MLSALRIGTLLSRAIRRMVACVEWTMFTIELVRAWTGLIPVSLVTLAPMPRNCATWLAGGVLRIIVLQVGWFIPLLCPIVLEVPLASRILCSFGVTAAVKLTVFSWCRVHLLCPTLQNTLRHLSTVVLVLMGSVQMTLLLLVMVIPSLRQGSGVALKTRVTFRWFLILSSRIPPLLWVSVRVSVVVMADPLALFPLEIMRRWICD